MSCSSLYTSTQLSTTTLYLTSTYYSTAYSVFPASATSSSATSEETTSQRFTLTRGRLNPIAGISARGISLEPRGPEEESNSIYHPPTPTTPPLDALVKRQQVATIVFPISTATTVITSTITSLATFTLGSDACGSDGRSLSTGAIAGISVVAGVFLLSLLVLGVWFARRRKRLSANIERKMSLEGGSEDQKKEEVQHETTDYGLVHYDSAAALALENGQFARVPVEEGELVVHGHSGAAP